VIGECEIVTLSKGVTSIFRVIRKPATLERMMPHFDLRIEENTERR
jgi:hypothetical protein